MTNAEAVRRYLAALVDHDYDTQAELRHPEWTAVWPQSGEVVRGDANMRSILENYPGGPPNVSAGRLVGSEDRWAVTPLGGAYRVAGEGESWWGDWPITYSDGSKWMIVTLIELRDGKIHRETSYWSEPFAPAAWRAQWVEQTGGGSGGRTLPGP
ncbi:MAG: nuclear transport factor 2 family protein [Chloroflexota bacterium]